MDKLSERIAELEYSGRGQWSGVAFQARRYAVRKAVEMAREEEARECVWDVHHQWAQTWGVSCSGRTYPKRDIDAMTYCPHCKGRIRIKEGGE